MRPSATAIPLPRPRPPEAPGPALADAPAPEVAGRSVFDADADTGSPTADMFDAAVNAFPAPSSAAQAPLPVPAPGPVGALQAAVFPSAVAAPVTPPPAATPAPAPADSPAAVAPISSPQTLAAQGAPQTTPQPPAATAAQGQEVASNADQGASHDTAQGASPEADPEQAEEPDQGSSQGGGPAATAAHAADGHAKDAHAPDTHAPPRDTRPVDLLRRLQRLQDRLAAGTSEGLPAQRDLISQIDAAYAGFPQEIWQDERNGRALAVYFLSGGTPGVLRKILDREPAPSGDIRLLRGILAYAEGRGEEALRFLGEVDARTQPNALGGQIALAQAALVVRQDPAKASDLLDLARLLLPGTLVEEAALRRQILVESQSPDISRFQRLTRQYLFRFRHSVYAGNFRQRFAAALTRMPFVNDPAQFVRLEEMLKPIEPEGQRDIYLLIARAALTQGRTTAAALCAERALALAPPASVDAERARLYGAAAVAASAGGYAAALKTLAGLDRNRLDPSDIALLDAASEAARTVRDASRVPVQQVSTAPGASTAPAPPPAAPASKANAPQAVATPPAVAAAQAAAAPQVAAGPQAAASQAAAAQGAAAQAGALSEEPDTVKGARAQIEAVDALLKEAPR
ncbi:hypothetical protein [Aquabacter sediminis]|uniref:hypothetical protein n=1 Tax=Aquabacter sediminis TaxID=3029197 RepID=UPI00237D4990|nr:hypothetical protein [Aquabacter sp. P-9]MDE1568677.1 hypothetical protein [Aquabacter sp. P-9]